MPRFVDYLSVPRRWNESSTAKPARARVRAELHNLYVMICQKPSRNPQPSMHCTRG